MAMVPTPGPPSGSNTWRNCWTPPRARRLTRPRHCEIDRGRMAWGDGKLRGTEDQCLEASHAPRSEEHTSELQSPDHLVCRLLLEKKKKKRRARHAITL